MREESVCGPSRGGNTESSTSEHTAYCTQRYANRISLYQCEPVRYAIRSVMNDCVFFCGVPYSLKEHSPTRNQLPLKTHEENSKNSKTQNPHILGVSMKGALSGKKEEKKSADSGRPNPCRDGAEVVSETGGFL